MANIKKFNQHLSERDNTLLKNFMLAYERYLDIKDYPEILDINSEFIKNNDLRNVSGQTNMVIGYLEYIEKYILGVISNKELLEHIEKKETSGFAFYFNRNIISKEEIDTIYQNSKDVPKTLEKILNLIKNTQLRSVDLDAIYSEVMNKRHPERYKK